MITPETIKIPFKQQIKNEIMKLELKHLATYLPYNLKYQLYGNFPIKEGVENIIKDIRVIDLKNIQKVIDWETCKPILRPLSDLTKEITHNGETFVPVEWFEIGDDENLSIEFDFGNIKTIKSLESLAKNGFCNDIIFFPYGLTHQLIEWHFDVFGLIDNGLAIDINSL